MKLFELIETFLVNGDHNEIGMFYLSFYFLLFKSENVKHKFCNFLFFLFPLPFSLQIC